MSSRIPLTLALASALAAPTALAQTCYPDVRASAPASRYVVNAAKGTVLDKQTGLTWKRCVEGRSGAACVGNEAYLTWGEALRRAESSTFAGYKDWRVPDRKELESLVEVACVDPAINTLSVFPNDPSNNMWSSSPHAFYAYSAWEVDFVHGHSSYDNRFYLHAVRLVRGGQ